MSPACASRSNKASRSPSASTTPHNYSTRTKEKQKARIFPWASGLPINYSILNPNGGSGAGFQFTLPVSDASAASNIGFAELLFNGSLSGTSGCLIHYDQSGGVIYLGDDSQPTWVDSGAPGSTGTLHNSQCT